MMNPGFAQNVAAQFFLSIPYQVTKTSWLAVLVLNSNIQWKDLENDQDSSLSLKPSNLELLVNQFNNTIPKNSNDPAKNFSSKYYDNKEMQDIEILRKSKLLSQFHINAYSLNKHFDVLEHLLRCTKKLTWLQFS